MKVQYCDHKSLPLSRQLEPRLTQVYCQFWNNLWPFPCILFLLSAALLLTPTPFYPLAFKIRCWVGQRFTHRQGKVLGVKRQGLVVRDCEVFLFLNSHLACVPKFWFWLHSTLNVLPGLFYYSRLTIPGILFIYSCVTCIVLFSLPCLLQSTTMLIKNHTKACGKVIETGPTVYASWPLLTLK